MTKQPKAIQLFQLELDADQARDIANGLDYLLRSCYSVYAQHILASMPDHQAISYHKAKIMKLIELRNMFIDLSYSSSLERESAPTELAGGQDRE